MATAKGIDYNTYRVCLDAIEENTVRIHGDREGLAIDDAMADVVEQKLAEMSEAFCHEEDEARGKLQFTLDQMDIDMVWPKNGPMSSLTDSERAFVKSVIDSAVDMACHIVIHSRIAKEFPNVLERPNGGMGTGESSVPVN